MKNLTLLCAGSLIMMLATTACGSDDSSLPDEPEPTEKEQDDSAEEVNEDQVTTHFTYSEKMTLGYHNPLSDYMFCADPTAVEYDGRLYVYGTNDTQQLDEGIPGADNTFEKIHSFQVMSTEDMVNWTYHGTIDVKEIAPTGKGVAWAPSIVSRQEADGKTHFYMYYSSSGSGVGLLTATNPLGPWTAPLGSNDFIDYHSTAIGDCPNPFDPGVVIDDNGTAWLAFGGGVASTGSDYLPGTARICRLSADMLSIDSEIQPIPAPYFFEASELYYLGGRWIYMYNTSWKARNQWELTNIAAPSSCCMSYMTSDDPLQPSSWTYQGIALRNPGHEGMEYGNNHAHIHKYKGNYYMLYHTQHYLTSIGWSGGYRSICVDPIDVNESTGEITCGKMTLQGVTQISTLDGFKLQSASQASATYGITYEPGEQVGEMLVHGCGAGQVFRVDGVNAVGASKLCLTVKGEGSIYLRKDTPNGKLLGKISFDTSDWEVCTIELNSSITDVSNLCFSFGTGDFYFQSWQFTN